MEVQDGGERQRLRRPRFGMIGEQAHEAERFGTQVGSNHGFRTGSVVALVEEQVDGALDARKTLGQICVGQFIERAGAAHDLLRTLQPLRHRGRRGHERSRDLGIAEPARELQDQGELRSFGESRLGERKHDTELVVMQRLLREQLVDAERQLLPPINDN
jgi:hypothetical protein